ncbi:MAG: Na/Pi cotransporter family protein [Dethiobacteria bacterium]|jgi:phosphate:Na+ symporter
MKERDSNGEGISMIIAGKIVLAIFLLLLGIKYVSKSLKEITGGLFHNLLKTYTSKSWSGFVLGLVTTIFLQSSSLVTVMVVGFVNAGFLSLTQGLGIIIGANVGTTFTSQLFAMETKSIILPFIFAGVFLYLLELMLKRAFGGKVMLGIALVFSGIEVFPIALKPLSQTTFFKELIMFSKGTSWKGIVTGTFAAAILQSSSVTIGLVILLVKEKVLGLSESIAIIMGADLGTCLTSLLASIGTILPARQVACGHLLVNLACLLIVLPFWRYFIWLINITSSDCSRQVAIAHALYNIIGAIVLLPLVDILAKVLQTIVKDKNNTPIRRI